MPQKDKGSNRSSFLPLHNLVLNSSANKLNNPLNNELTLLLELANTFKTLFTKLEPTTITITEPKYNNDPDLQATISLLQVAITTFIEDSKKINLIEQLEQQAAKNAPNAARNYQQELEAILAHLCDDLCAILHVLDPATLQALNVSQEQINVLQTQILTKAKLQTLATAFANLAQQAQQYTETIGSFTEAQSKINQLLHSIVASSEELTTTLRGKQDFKTQNK